MSKEEKHPEIENDSHRESQGEPLCGSPEVYALKQNKSGWQFSRRNFLAASGAAVAALAAAGCTTDSTKKLNRLCRTVSAHTGSTDVIKLSPDGTLMASFGMFGNLKLWSMPEGQLLKSVEVSRATYMGLEFSPDGKLLASSGVPAGSIDLWSLPDMESSQKIESHSEWVTSLAFSPDGSLLAVGSSTGVINIWSIPEGTKYSEIRYKKPSLFDSNDVSDTVRSLAFTPDGSTLAAGFVDAIHFYSLPDCELVNSITEDVDMLEVMAISPDGSLLCTNAYYSIVLWSLPEGKRFKSLGRPDEDFIYSLAISPDGSIMATGDSGNNVRLWSLPDCEPLNILEGHTNAVQYVAFSSDGTILASGGNDDTIRFWSTADGKLLACPVDVAAMTSDMKAKTYEIVDSSGAAVTYTIPCRSALPEGAVCTCNCVKGTGVCACDSHSSGGGSSHYWHPD